MALGKGVDAVFEPDKNSPKKLLKELLADFKKYVEDYYSCYEGDESYYNEVGLKKIEEWEDRLKEI